jgi:hypothetical protein
MELAINTKQQLAISNYAHKRTLIRAPGMSALCHNRTHAPQPNNTRSLSSVGAQ